jgi:hypothetical protein
LTSTSFWCQHPRVYDEESNIIDGKDPNVSVPVAIFQSFYDAPGGFSEEMQEFTQSFGHEYWYNQQFALRAGYYNEAQSSRETGNISPSEPDSG